MEKIYLSIVVPAYNEEKNIKAGVLDEIYNYLSIQKYSWEVLFVNDGSSDSTLKLLNNFSSKDDRFRVFDKPHRGKAGTVIAGMLEARGEIILFTDMDQATPINQLKKLLPKFEETLPNGGQAYDVVIGSRQGREGYSLTRMIMAYGFMVLRTLILNLPYKDTQCGFKAFRREVAYKIFERMRVFNEKRRSAGSAVTAGFDLEILYIARKLKFKVAEVNVDWHERGFRKEVRPIRDSLEGLKDLLRVRINAILGRYST